MEQGRGFLLDFLVLMHCDRTIAKDETFTSIAKDKVAMDH